MAALLLVATSVGVRGGYEDEERPGAHGMFTAVLETHVRDGRVDYAALCHDEQFPEYIAALSQVDPARLPGDAARLAFWINAYNAFTLKAICDEYPVKSINDLHFGGRIVGAVLGKTVWDRKFIVINGEEFSLNDIEHEIIRKRFEEPRIHFALVCAAKSCPPLRSEAFEGSELEGQLADQARRFLQDENKNHFDLEKRIAYLSKIIDWYGNDFGSNRAEVLAAIAPYLSDEVARSIEADPDAWRISYLDYDWSLNE